MPCSCAASPPRSPPCPAQPDNVATPPSPWSKVPVSCRRRWPWQRMVCVACVGLHTRTLAIASWASTNMRPQKLSVTTSQTYLFPPADFFASNPCSMRCTACCASSKHSTGCSAGGRAGKRVVVWTWGRRGRGRIMRRAGQGESRAERSWYQGKVARPGCDSGAHKHGRVGWSSCLMARR